MKTPLKTALRRQAAQEARLRKSGLPVHVGPLKEAWLKEKARREEARAVWLAGRWEREGFRG